jgi:hypothetical protein
MGNCKCGRPRNCSCVRHNDWAMSCGCGRKWPASKVCKCGGVKEWQNPGRLAAMGCPNCVPLPVTTCGQAEIGGRHIYIDFSGIYQSNAKTVEQIFLTVVNSYAATVFQCFSSVGGTDYYDPCERPSFVSEFYHNGRLDYGIVTYLFSHELRIEAEQLAIQITNDINVALTNAGLLVTASYRF